MYIARALFNAEKPYVPKAYPGLVVMFHGSDCVDDPKSSWDGLAAGIEHHVIGDNSQTLRRDLMREPLVGQTARELCDCISRACDTSEFKTRRLHEVRVVSLSRRIFPDENDLP